MGCWGVKHSEVLFSTSTAENAEDAEQFLNCPFRQDVAKSATFGGVFAEFLPNTPGAELALRGTCMKLTL